MICSKFASVNIATQFKLTLPLHYSSILSLIFLFFFNVQFSFFSVFVCQIWFTVNFCLNLSTFLPFALFQFFILISYHLHLFTLSYSHPPTSPLPLPCLGWSRLWSSPGIVCTNGLWTVIVIILYFCIFLYFDMYFVCKMIDVSFIWWIGLPDKLIRVSSPILLALR